MNNTSVAIIIADEWVEMFTSANEDIEPELRLLGPVVRHEELNDHAKKVKEVFGLVEEDHESTPTGEYLTIMNLAKLHTLMDGVKGVDLVQRIYEYVPADEEYDVEEDFFVICSTATLSEYLLDTTEVKTIDGITYYSNGRSANNIDKPVMFKIDARELKGYLDDESKRALDRIINSH